MITEQERRILNEQGIHFSDHQQVKNIATQINRQLNIREVPYPEILEIISVAISEIQTPPDNKVS